MIEKALKSSFRKLRIFRCKKKFSQHFTEEWV